MTTYALDEFRTLASEWHSGQWSPLYALASSGKPVFGLARDVALCVPVGGADSRRLAELHALADTAEVVALAIVDLFGFGLDELSDARVEGWSVTA